MSVLSAQSIRCLCVPHRVYGYYMIDRRKTYKKPLLDPFVERGVIRGKSFGLSACTYDCRISDGLLLPAGQFHLASTMERFTLPHDVCGSVLDKSSWARVGVSAFNTHLDPGFEGFVTIELVNLGTEAVEYLPGDPLCQVKFEWLDTSTDNPYRKGMKYFDQGPEPTPARYEKESE